MTFDIARLADIRRVNVVGTSGSGKTTLGRQLGRLLQIPFFELDDLYWKPDWQTPTDEEFLPRVRHLASRDAWVLDGNYSFIDAIKWSRVELVVWLNLSLPRTLYQITRRSLRRGMTRAEIWKGTGNRESLQRSFLSRESVILWAMQSHDTNRRRYTAAMQDPAWKHIWFVQLRTSAQIRQFLKAAERAGAATRMAKSRIGRVR